MRIYFLAMTLLLGIGSGYAQQGMRDDSWQLIWHDEFDNPIDWNVWQSEHGFVLCEGMATEINKKRIKLKNKTI